MADRSGPLCRCPAPGYGFLPDCPVHGRNEPIFAEAVRVEVGEIEDSGYEESVSQAIQRAIDLNDRYGADAEQAFWELLQRSYYDADQEAHRAS